MNPDRIPPWAHGPAELFRHAESHYQDTSDTDRRLAMIGFDNAIEVCIDAFVGLDPRHRGGYEITRVEREAVLRNYHTKINFLERYLAERGRLPDDVSFDEVIWYHQLRNELYHSGNGMIPERQHVLGIRDAARAVFRALFDRDVLPNAVGATKLPGATTTPVATSSAGGVRLEFLGAYIDLEKALADWAHEPKGRATFTVLWASFVEANGWARNFGSLVADARRIRNQLVHGQTIDAPPNGIESLTTRLRALAERVTAADRPDVTTPKESLRGRRLAHEAWQVAKKGDPTRSGISTIDLLDRLASDGVPIHGPQSTRVLYDALNNAPDLFRKNAGRFQWREIAPDGTDVGLSGIQLTMAISKLCGWINEEPEGRHYWDVSQRLRQDGVLVRGPNHGRTVNNAFTTGTKKGRFVRTGRGKYRCADGSQTHLAE